MSTNPAARGLFVTGTDTCVGKTVVAAGLTKLARNRGLGARAIKPVETGCRVREGVLYPEDGAFLQKASDYTVDLDECTPFRFSMPAAPFTAAAVEGKRLNSADLIEHIMALAQDSDLIIVEGAGGLMVPIEERFMIIDLIDRLAFPALLVARTGLGTINHTMLSVEALRTRSIGLAGIILSSTSGNMGPEEEFTPREIARLVEDVPVSVLPFLSAESLGSPALIAEAMTASFSDELLDKWIS